MIITDTTWGIVVSNYEGKAPFLMSQVTDKDNEQILKADISTLKATIYNKDTGEYVLDDVSLVINDVWYDTFQTGDDWGDRDSTGYNFGWQTEADWFITAGDDTTFVVEVWGQPVNGQQFCAGVWEIATKRSVRSVHEEPV